MSTDEKIRVRVRTPQKGGRRRIGRYFGDKFTVIDVTAEELAKLDADNMLAVERVVEGDEKRGRPIEPAKAPVEGDSLLTTLETTEPPKRSARGATSKA